MCVCYGHDDRCGHACLSVMLNAEWHACHLSVFLLCSHKVTPSRVVLDTMSVLGTRRLYSSAHFNDTFPAHTPPEILNTSLEGLVLLMKAMHVDKVGLPAPLHGPCC